MKLHKSITIERVCRLVDRAMRTLDNPGICIRCGKTNTGCEPDLRHGPCATCSHETVFGAEELLLEVA